MMERLTKIIALLFLFTIASLGLVNKTWAQDSQLKQQLTDISQKADKQAALEELKNLYKSPVLNIGEKAEVSLSQGRVLSTLHQYNQGIDAVNNAIELAQQSKLFSLKAQADKMLGILFYYQGELKPALKAYQISLAYYDDNQILGTDMFAIERANLLNNIALVYISLGQSNLALVNYQLAEPLYAQYGNEEDKIDVRYNIAALLISLRRFDSAIDILTVVIDKRQQLKDGHGVASAKADLGIAYKYSGQFSLAKENILSALEYFQKHDYKHDIAAQLHNMSELHNDMFNVEQAIFYGNKALIISEELGHQKAYAGSLQSLAKAFF